MSPNMPPGRSSLIGRSKVHPWILQLAPLGRAYVFQRLEAVDDGGACVGRAKQPKDRVLQEPAGVSSGPESSDVEEMRQIWHHDCS